MSTVAGAGIRVAPENTARVLPSDCLVTIPVYVKGVITDRLLRDQVFIDKTNGSSYRKSRPKPLIQPHSNTRATPCANGLLKRVGIQIGKKIWSKPSFRIMCRFQNLSLLADHFPDLARFIFGGRGCRFVQWKQRCISCSLKAQTGFMWSKSKLLCCILILWVLLKFSIFRVIISTTCAQLLAPR